LQGGGRRFDPDQLHHPVDIDTGNERKCFGFYESLAFLSLDENRGL
jgi:hypothetical protein